MTMKNGRTQKTETQQRAQLKLGNEMMLKETAWVLIRLRGSKSVILMKKGK